MTSYDTDHKQKGASPRSFVFLCVFTN